MVSLAGKRILVTGGAGFIGSHLVDRLVMERPAALVVVDNFYLGRDENLAQAQQAYKSLRVVRVDASDLASMQQLVRSEKLSVAFNLAVIPLPASFDYPAWTVRTNIDITLALCELARCGALETLIHFSSSEAYGTAQYVPMDEAHPLIPTTPYAASKAACDEIVRTYAGTFGIDTLIVRPFNNVGPRQNDRTFAGILPIVAQRLRDKQPIEIYGDGRQTRDYTYVEDTAEAAIRLYETPRAHGQTVNVATGHELSVNDLVGRILDIVGAPHHPVVHCAERPADVRRHCGDVRRLMELTGLAPTPISDERLRVTLDWYERSDRV
jgi:UDP-glucose 4-epimerase